MRSARLTGLVLVATVLAGPGVATPAADPFLGDRYLCPRTDEDGLEVERLEGKMLSRARDIARRYECTVRVVERNGEPLGVTDDFRGNRVNVAVKHRRIVRVSGTY